MRRIECVYRQDGKHRRQYMKKQRKSGQCVEQMKRDMSRPQVRLTLHGRLTFLTETQTCIWWEQQKLTAGAWLSSVCAEAGDAMCLPEGVELVEETGWKHDPE